MGWAEKFLRIRGNLHSWKAMPQCVMSLLIGTISFWQYYFGGSRRGLEKTGGPLVMRWCLTLCVKESLKLAGLLRIGYFSIILAISTGVLARCIVVGFDLERDPMTTSDVELSISLRLARSTDRLKCTRKSAPRIDFWTSATMKIQLNCCRRFRLSCRDFWPNVFMTVLFAAWRV